MKSDKLQDAIGNIDDEYINEAYKAKKKKGWATKAAGAVISAACFAFILVSGALKTTAPDPMPEDTKGTTDAQATRIPQQPRVCQWHKRAAVRYRSMLAKWTNGQR